MGRWRSNQSAAGIDARIINGHRTDVIALSPTAKEKSKPPVPPLSVSTWAKRIEYVPICALANPVFTAPFGGLANQQRSQRPADELAGDGDDGEHRQRKPVACQQLRIDEHADRDEKDRAVAGTRKT